MGSQLRPSTQHGWLGLLTTLIDVLPTFDIQFHLARKLRILKWSTIMISCNALDFFLALLFPSFSWRAREKREDSIGLGHGERPWWGFVYITCYFPHYVLYLEWQLDR